MNLLNKNKLFYFSVVICLFITIFLTETLLVGCSNKSNEEKVVPNNNQVNAAETQSLTLTNLSKLSEYGMARGWINDTNIILLTSKLSSSNSDEYLNSAVHQWSEMINFNTTKSSSTNITENRIIRDASINNSKTKLAFIEELENNTLQVVIKELSTGTETVITSIDARTKLNWSNNSKYLTFVKLDTLVIYDSSINSINELPVKDLEIRPEDTNFKISDNGKNALVKNRNLYSVDIPDFTKDTSTEYLVTTTSIDTDINSDYFDFYDNTKFLYISASGELTGLYLYNLSTTDKALISSDISGFSLSPEHNKITFCNFTNDLLSIGNFDGTNISNTNVIFEGTITGDILWNISGNKVLFYSDSNYYIATLKYNKIK